MQASYGQTTIFQFTFEYTEDVTTDNAVGTPTFTANGVTTPTYPLGYQIANCASTGGFARSHNGWDTNDYYRFTVDATGYNTLSFSTCLRASNVAIGTFEIRASFDAGANWTPIQSFTPTTGGASYGGSLPAAFDGQANIWIEVFKTNNADLASNTLRIDNSTLTGTASPSNTIAAPATPSPITLTDCADTEDILISGVSSTGTFNTGNQYTAQLSDASGSFASPIATASVSSTSNTIPNLTLVVPAATPTGTGYKVRIISTNPAVTGTESAAFTITQSGTCVSTATDYFRSKQTGNWNTTATWESSPDNTTWINATLVPNNNANTITIQTGHNVSITDARTFDQAVVNGTLTLNSGTNTITIANGTGEDLTVNSGGLVNVDGTNISNITFTGTVAVGNGGIVRYTSGGGSNIAQTLAGTSTNTKIVYGDGGIFEWNNTGSFGSSNVTYFATSVSTHVPIFRILQNTASVGAGVGNPTTFNGILEINGTITFQNAGIKTFRNGIIGTGTLTQAATSGVFQITGTTATLAGAGTIALNTAGMSSTATTLTLNSNKTINGSTFTITSGTFATGTNTLSGTTNFTLASGATLRTANTNGLMCIGVTGTKTFTAGANYVFNGTALQTINNPTGISANNLTIENSAGARLSNHLTVTGTLTLTNGDLDLNGQNITLNGTLAEDRANNHIVLDHTATSEASPGGAITLAGTVSPTSGDIAGAGLYLQRTTGSDYTVTITRRHYQGAGAGAGGKGIKRIYEVAGTPAGTNTTMRIYYASDELAGVSGSLVLYRWQLATGWKQATDAGSGFANGTNGTDYVEATGINAFSSWTVGASTAPLPITLLGFRGERVEQGGEKSEEVRLRWQTAHETNNKGFEVEMSEDGLAYQKIAFVEGKGNSSSLNSYQITFNNASDSYYRLKQIDFNGKFSYSPVVFVEGLVGELVVYPNPNKGTFTISPLSLDRRRISLRTAQGVEVPFSIEGNNINISPSGQGASPSGIYFLHTVVAGKAQVTKVVIER